MKSFLTLQSCYLRNLQIKLDQPVSAPASPRDSSNGEGGDRPSNSTPEQLTSHIQWLRNEVARLKHQLTSSLQERKFFIIFLVKMLLNIKYLFIFYRRRKNGALCTGRKTHSRRKFAATTPTSDGNGTT